MTAERPVTEEDLDRLVRRFYERGQQDPRLGPVFAGAIVDWEDHFRIVADFWSHVLLGTDRYTRHPFGPHMRLPIEPEHFDRWLELFTATANEVLPPAGAAAAIGRATHMTQSFRVGLFPWTLPDGRVSRHPPKKG